jgi:hypothetical protein
VSEFGNVTVISTPAENSFFKRPRRAALKLATGFHHYIKSEFIQHASKTEFAVSNYGRLTVTWVIFCGIFSKQADFVENVKNTLIFPPILT